MSTYKSFALVGATGYAGKHILKAFLSVGISPLILTRKTSNTDTLAAFLSSSSESLNVAKVDIENVNEVAQVLKEYGVEVIVSAVPGGALEIQQKALADAAKKAGVKLFAPSEYGVPTEGLSYSTPYLGAKAQFAVIQII